MSGRALPRLVVGLIAVAALASSGGCETLFLVPTTYGCGGDPIKCSNAEFTPRSACAEGCSQAKTCLARDCQVPEIAATCSADLGCRRVEWSPTLCLVEINSLGQCPVISDEAACVARVDCRWGLHCTDLLYPCYGIEDQSTCQATPTCFWHRDGN